MSQRTTLTINPLDIIHRRTQKDENNCRRHQSGWKMKLSSKDRCPENYKLAQSAYPILVQGIILTNE